MRFSRSSNHSHLQQRPRNETCTVTVPRRFRLRQGSGGPPSCDQRRFKILAYVFMEGHLHLLIEGESEDTSNACFAPRITCSTSFNISRTIRSPRICRLSARGIRTCGGQRRFSDTRSARLQPPVRAAKESQRQSDRSGRSDAALKRRATSLYSSRSARCQSTRTACPAGTTQAAAPTPMNNASAPSNVGT